MGEYVEARELVVGDFWASLGRNSVSRRVDDITFGHVVHHVDGERVHRPTLIIKTKDLTANLSPGSRVYRSARAVSPIVTTWEHGGRTGYDLYINGVHYAHMTLVEDESAWAYRHTDGLRGYVLDVEYFQDVIFGFTSGRSTSLAEVVDTISKQVAHQLEKLRETAEA